LLLVVDQFEQLFTQCVLRDYLSAARTTSAKALAAKAAVLVYPEQLAGTVAWPPALSADVFTSHGKHGQDHPAAAGIIEVI
jgi:hypothetical protein